MADQAAKKSKQKKADTPWSRVELINRARLNMLSAIRNGHAEGAEQSARELFRLLEMTW